MDKARLTPDDIELKKARAFASNVQEYPSMLERLEYFSSWHRAKKAIVICLGYRSLLLQRVRKRKQDGDFLNTKKPKEIPLPNQPVHVSDLNTAELKMIKFVQNQEFKSELGVLSPKSKKDDGPRNIPKASPLARLDPFVDEHGTIRVGGRIRRSTIDANVKHLVIMPKKSHVTKLIARRFHERIRHQGRGMTWNEICASGYWIVGRKDIVAKVIKDCTICQKLRARFEDQKMVDLPKERVETSAPFLYSIFVKIKFELVKDNCDWVEFNFNVRKTSHMGGIWERRNRTVRNVLNVLYIKMMDN